MLVRFCWQLWVKCKLVNRKQLIDWFHFTNLWELISW